MNVTVQRVYFPFCVIILSLSYQCLNQKILSNLHQNVFVNSSPFFPFLFRALVSSVTSGATSRQGRSLYYQQLSGKTTEIFFLRSTINVCVCIYVCVWISRAENVFFFFVDHIYSKGVSYQFLFIWWCGENFGKNRGKWTAGGNMREHKWEENLTGVL